MKLIIKLPKTEITANEIIEALTISLNNPDKADQVIKKLYKSYFQVIANQKYLKGEHSQN